MMHKAIVRIRADNVTMAMAIRVCVVLSGLDVDGMGLDIDGDTQPPVTTSAKCVGVWVCMEVGGSS